jgi:hypothetical protein
MPLTNETMTIVMELADVLSRARNESRFKLEEEVTLLSPNDEPIAKLRWHSQRQEYNFVQLL